MNLTTVPGYTDLFGPPPKTYGQFLENIPATLVLPVLIGINAEMYASLSDDENQRRMRNIFSDNFTVEQAARMNNAYARYKRIVNPAYNDEVFGNRYLVHMCIRELNCNRTADKTVLTQEDEFNILQAYLLVVQEINDSDKECYDKLRQAPMDKDHDYRLIWTGLIKHISFIVKVKTAFRCSGNFQTV